MKVLSVAGLILALALATATATAQPGGRAPQTWRGCCGVSPWPLGGMMGGSGMMGGTGGHGMMGGSAARHHIAMMGGVPAPYTDVRNPLPVSASTIERGAAVYSANCASCHGATGFGDGAAAHNLAPRPANLAWLSNMPISHWDPFMYWTIAEGGKPFGTGMPPFKDALSKDDIWAVTAYIQAHLPQGKAGR